MFATAASVVPQIARARCGRWASPAQAHGGVPELPTIDELGLKGFDATTWHGLVAPARTPKEIVAALNRALVATLDDPASRSRSATSASTSSAAAGGFRRLHQGGNPEMDRDRQGLGRQAGVRHRPGTRAAHGDKVQGKTNTRQPSTPCPQRPRLAHLDLPGAGQVTSTATTPTSATFPTQQLGTTIVDVADPRKPRVVADQSRRPRLRTATRRA